jgi:site-specific DNA recombinase
MHPGLHEPIIDAATFEVAGRILAERGESQALRRAHPTEYLLSGVIRCGQCRRAYVGTSARGRRGLYHYYVCSTRYRYGTEHCSGERLPKGALEEALMDQMQEVYANSSLIERALADAAAEDAESAENAARRLSAVQQELAGARRSLDRYFAAFEEGSLSPADCQERIAKLKVRIDALFAEEAALSQRAAERSQAPTAVDVAEWARDLGTLLRSGTPQQRKALFRLLVKELRVMSREEILPTYKIPALVRAPEGQVVSVLPMGAREPRCRSNPRSVARRPRKRRPATRSCGRPSPTSARGTERRSTGRPPTGGRPASRSIASSLLMRPNGGSPWSRMDRWSATGARSNAAASSS